MSDRKSKRKRLTMKFTESYQPNKDLKAKFLQRVAERWEAVGGFGTVEEAACFVLAERIAGERKLDIPEVEAFLRRVIKRSEAGADSKEAWRFALAELLQKGRRSQWLLEAAADELVKEYGPKIKAERWRKLKPQLDREMIDVIAQDLKVGVGKAKEEWAKMQGISVDGLKQRRRRARHQRSEV